MKNPKLVIGIITIVVLLIIFFVILSNSKKVVVTKGGTSVQQAGFFDYIMAIFQHQTTSTSTSGGGNANAIWCSIFPNSPSCQKNKYCDCSNPGYTLDGDVSSLCTEGIGDTWIKDCK